MANMKSLREIYVSGPGPSSSHTIGPYRIAEHFRKSIAGQDTERIEITLFQSLAFTGKGHLTDEIMKKALDGYKVNVSFDIKTPTEHPNTLRMEAFFKDGSTKSVDYVSYGGGVFGVKGQPVESPDVYPFSSFQGLKAYMEEKKIDDVFEAILHFEGPDILAYAENALDSMFQVIEKGLRQEGVLPGSLKLKRVAAEVNKKAVSITDNPVEKETLLLSSYAYACAEENASGDFVVTAPTCGSSGVVPSVLYYECTQRGQSKEKAAKALLVGGMAGNFIKTNASISGAVDGCQAEIGTAASMAAAALCYLNGLSFHQIEYAAEVAMEHFLGLTCDPVGGYVQIPCIERNAMASVHAYTAYLYAKDISKMRQNEISFDEVVEAMKVTGDSLSPQYKETSLGGLAEIKKTK
jgi:L-serine dehydratase